MQGIADEDQPIHGHTIGDEERSDAPAQRFAAGENGSSSGPFARHVEGRGERVAEDRFRIRSPASMFLVREVEPQTAHAPIGESVGESNE
jgi:hypothetical protein